MKIPEAFIGSKVCVVTRNMVQGPGGSIGFITLTDKHKNNPELLSQTDDAISLKFLAESILGPAGEYHVAKDIIQAVRRVSDIATASAIPPPRLSLT